ncbi:MAG: DUF4339 domain-containing protein, partial [Bdellovibrionales bacterium]|nr:DUF4339 domain-containing protein [Bdellovibrionales bacterium]
MEKEWFIYKGDHHTGPYDIEDVHKMFLDGNVEDSDLVWKEGLSNWVSLKILLQEHGVEVQRPKKTKFKFPTIVDTPPSTYFEDYPNLQMRNEEDIVEKDFSDIEQKDVSEV